jgi:hypothetical protein
MSEASTFADPLTERLVAFVRGIGIEVRAATLPEKTFLPGLDIRHGAILVDAERLAHPGDILHEAGHLAVTDPAERRAPTLSPTGGDEMTSIAWSFAALRHLGLDPAIVFHDDGYKARRRSSRISRPAAISACRCCSSTAWPSSPGAPPRQAPSPIPTCCAGCADRKGILP